MNTFVPLRLHDIYGKRMQTLCVCMLRVACGCLIGLTLVMVAGCGPVRLVAASNIPTPLIVKIPVGVALFIPAEFSQYVHVEERWSTNWHIELGKAQTEGMTRLLNAMFERVVIVDSVNAASRLGDGIQVVLEPSIEEYAFVTPRDAGSQFFAVSIKYRVNVYQSDGKLADSWGFTGYGSSPARGLSSEAPLAAATALAMRDAGAKLAVEFREQAVVRGLLSEAEPADTSGRPEGVAADPVAMPALDPEPAQPGVGSAPAAQAESEPELHSEPKLEPPSEPRDEPLTAPPGEPLAAPPISDRQSRLGRFTGEVPKYDCQRPLLAGHCASV